jgi:hypothetical protein
MKKKGRVQRYKMDQRKKQDEKKFRQWQGRLSLVTVVCCVK